METMEEAAKKCEQSHHQMQELLREAVGTAFQQ